MQVSVIVSGRLHGFSMTRSLQAVAYCRPSVLESAAAGQRLGLETSRGATPAGVEEHPRFFAGFLTSPQVATAGLLAVADVAAARYYQRQLRVGRRGRCPGRRRDAPAPRRVRWGASVSSTGRCR
ncbi:hypothetical protein GCM10022233_26640 [Streptomyces shaanxiensis]|uniref:Uncharacterized protein n=1 Tax=Streptomyces shaanxiensis TaxID=653357 RepID=A0ABP7UVG6_9ACTN